MTDKEIKSTPYGGMVCPWDNPAKHHAWGYLKQGWERGVKEERERVAQWLLGEVEFVQAGELNCPLPRYVALGFECVERYRKTGELRLFEVQGPMMGGSDDNT